MRISKNNGKYEVILNDQVLEICESKEFAEEFISGMPALDERPVFEEFITGFEDE